MRRLKAGWVRWRSLAAREKLAQIDDENDAPDRVQPPVGDAIATAAE